MLHLLRISACNPHDRGRGHDHAENFAQAAHRLPLDVFSIIPSGLFECQSNMARNAGARWEDDGPSAANDRSRRLLRRHHPRKRMIQYSAPFRFYLKQRRLLDAPLSRSMTAAFMRAKKTLPLPLAAHEIEIAAFVGLQDALVEQMRVAAFCPIHRRRGLKRRAALFELSGVDQQIDASVGDIEPD